MELIGEAAKKKFLRGKALMAMPLRPYPPPLGLNGHRTSSKKNSSFLYPCHFLMARPLREKLLFAVFLKQKYLKYKNGKKVKRQM